MLSVTEANSKKDGGDVVEGEVRKVVRVVWAVARSWAREEGLNWASFRPYRTVCPPMLCDAKVPERQAGMQAVSATSATFIV